MKAIHSLLTMLLVPACIQAATVESPTPLRITPEGDAPVAITIKAGSELVAADEAKIPADLLPLPEGWMAVEHYDSYQGYVGNEDVLKDFSVDLGVGILLEPSIDSPLMTIVEDTDDTEVIEVVGEWSKVAVRKPLLGYVNLADATLVESIPTEATVTDEVVVDDVPPLPPPPMVNPAVNVDLAPILLSGRLERTRRFFGQGPEQNYQLIDKNGRVIAYLEVATLLTTQKVDSFLGLTVNVFGVPRKPPGSKALILKVESLRLPPQPH